MSYKIDYGSCII